MIDVDFVSNSRGDWLVHVSAEDVATAPDCLEVHPDRAFLHSGGLSLAISDFGPSTFLSMLPSLAKNGKITVALMRGGEPLHAAEIPVVIGGRHE